MAVQVKPAGHAFLPRNAVEANFLDFLDVGFDGLDAAFALESEGVKRMLGEQGSRIVSAEPFKGIAIIFFRYGNRLVQSGYFMLEGDLVAHHHLDCLAFNPTKLHGVDMFEADDPGERRADGDGDEHVGKARVDLPQNNHDGERA